LRCVIVDDNRGFLDAATLWLEYEGLDVVGVASSSAEAVREVERLRPDLVLVDIGLGEESGLELTRRLAAADPDARTAVVLISTRAERDVADLLASCPTAGFVPKAELS